MNNADKPTVYYSDVWGSKALNVDTTDEGVLIELHSSVPSSAELEPEIAVNLGIALIQRAMTHPLYRGPLVVFHAERGPRSPEEIRNSRDLPPTDADWRNVERALGLPVGEEEVGR